MTKRYAGRPVDDIPDEYDSNAVKRALHASPSKQSTRVSWSEYDDLEETENHPDWVGHPNQTAVLEAGRCGSPVRESIRRFGHLRYCTRLPARRMGQANWKTGSDFCTSHRHLEKKVMPVNELWEYHLQSGPLPFETFFD